MQVVLVVRGTTSLADTLTDLSGHLVPFGGGGAEGDVPEGDVPQTEVAKPSDGRSSGDSTANSDGQVSSSRSGGEPASGKGNSSGAGSGDPSGTGRASAAADSSSSSDRREASSNSSGGSSRQAGEPEGMAHNGILRAAQSLLREQGPTLGELLRDNPGYRLKVGWKNADPILMHPSQTLPLKGNGAVCSAALCWQAAHVRLESQRHAAMEQPLRRSIWLNTHPA